MIYLKISVGNNAHEDTQHMSSDIRFPTMWHFDKCRLIWACAGSFKAKKLQTMFAQ